MASAKKVAVIKGDGTGPELVESALRVIRASGAKVELRPCDAGAEWWEKHKGPSFFPDETWKVLESSDCCLKGPTTSYPIPGTPRSVAVSIRQKFNLYANVRPVKTFPGQVGPLGEVDFVCVREATEGLYAGIEHRLSDEVAVAVRLITKAKSTKVTRFAFEEAKRRGWKKVVAISKANILKVTDGLFLDCAREVKRGFPGIELEDLFIDNFSQQLVKNPQRFNENVLVSTNLFMDIMSEEASGLIGSIGMVYSGNFGDDYAMFEPAHGSTPKYKGMDKVNPVATVLSAAWMLEYLGFRRAASAVFGATLEVVKEGKQTTYDLGGKAGTREMTQAILKRM
ncbi:MAG TPA: isocitrate/isopropylmalate dehydrogenase family protein [Nitrososphaerales archaeon]|nr:isocitrate/isopropylmalate dehydrogenase family protein [Nitrososphaerales archaeon]